MSQTTHSPTDIALHTAPSFVDTVRRRQSYRDFLPAPVPGPLLREVLTDAQCSPSNCNTQPWNMHIVSGQTRQDLSRALHEANKQGQVSPDFFWDEKAYRGAYGERRQEQGGIYYRNLGVARDDLDGRAAAGARNFSFFGAPHVAMLFMPTVGDGVRVAGDLGMYGQTFLLALAARGLGGVPQTVLGLYADTVRDVLGISPDLKLLYGISFGYPDLGAASNRTPMGRADLSESVTFHS